MSFSKKSFLLIVVCFLFSIATAQPKKFKIGIITDCQTQVLSQTLDNIMEECRKLLGEDIEIGQQIIVNQNCSRVEASNALNQMLTDSNVDLIIGVGVVTSDVMSKSGPYHKPVLASLVINPIAQNIDIKPDRTTGIKNLSCVVMPFSPQRDLEIFKRMVDFNHLAIIMDGYTLENIPELNNFLIKGVKSLGVSYQMIRSYQSVDEVIDQITDSTDAVYLLPTNQLGAAGKRKLIDTINEKKLPSYSAVGRSDIDLGVLTGIGNLSNFKRLSRRVALNIQQIMEGTPPDQIGVDLKLKEELVLNVQVARNIDFNPSWEFLAEAQLVNNTKEDVEVRYNLRSIVAIALESNLDLSVAFKDFQSVAQEVNIAKAAFWPQIQASASAKRIDEDRAEISNGQSPESQGFLSGSLNQLLYDDQVFANKQIQQLIFEAADAQYQAQTLDLILDISFAYLDVLQTKTAEEIQKVNLEVTRKNLELARASQSIGQTGLSDVYRWQSEISIAKIDLIQAGVTRQNAEFELNRIINKKINEEFVLADVNPDDPLIIFNDQRGDRYIKNARDYRNFADFLVKEAHDNLPDLQVLESNLAAQQRALKNARRRFYAPKVSLQAGLDQEIYRGGAGVAPFIPGFELPNDTYWQVGLGASIPVFTGFQRKAYAQQQQLQTELVQDQQASLSIAIESNVRSSLENVRGSLQNIQLSEEAEEAAAKNFEIVQDSYSQGRVSITRLLDAQRAAISARLNKANTVYIFIGNLFALGRSVGTYHFLSTDQEKTEFFNRLSNFLAQ